MENPELPVSPAPCLSSDASDPLLPACAKSMTCESPPLTVAETDADVALPRSTYQMPKVPSLFSALSMGQDASLERVYGAMSNAITIKHLDVIQLTLVNT
jgi:hypothetical protein